MRPEDKIAAAERELREVAAELSASLENETGRARGAISSQLWRIRKMTGGHDRYFSQNGQDWFADRLLDGKRHGVFVDVGGYDGVTGSNTLFFELFREWQGVLVDANAAQVDIAAKTRRCPCLHEVVAGSHGETEFIEIAAGYRQMSGRADTYDSATLEQVRAHPNHKEVRRKVPTRKLADILEEHQISAIDFLSVDVEGGELDILTSFPFDEIPVSVATIENGQARPELHAVMTQNGFRLVEFLGVDEVYCRPDLVGL